MQRTSFKRLLLTVVLMFTMNISMPSLANAHATSVQQQLAALEATSGGRLGLSAVDMSNQKRIQYRSNERFPLGCTAKVIGVAAMLKKSMSNQTLLNQNIRYTKADLTNWTPITEKHLAEGMTIEALCAAAISYSDNTAMNLLVKQLGGLQAMNSFARSLGDPFFRQDHGWPEEAKSGGVGNLADTSTPAAIENNLRQLAFGAILATPQRNLLLKWLKANTTGNARITAGVPKGWIVGDKTGTGSYYGTTNDIGIVWPPNCAPIVVAIYFTANNKDAAKREDIIAAATRIVLAGFGRMNPCIKLKSIA